MRIEHEPNMLDLRREWLVAREVGVIGPGTLLAMVVLVGSAYWPSGPSPVAVAPPAAPVAAPPTSSVVVPTTSMADARRQENIALCTAALGTAQKQGIVPAFAVLASEETQNTDVQGRYINLTKTKTARYSVDFDLTCTDLSTNNNNTHNNNNQAKNNKHKQQKKRAFR